MFIMITAFFVIPSISLALNVGDSAPLFDAESTEGTISLQNYLGQKHVVFAFYYADFTPV
jgi:alkyl hydroperoxide reductase subunit AhpC